mmetsp:Transcript_39799/g.104115  ORF Transcript_39799/g.104115 Transcript_39799/m.104115 type:complete len:997 (-) Transcript_39799:35-3025(-)
MLSARFGAVAKRQNHRHATVASKLQRVATTTQEQQFKSSRLERELVATQFRECQQQVNAAFQNLAASLGIAVDDDVLSDGGGDGVDDEVVSLASVLSSAAKGADDHLLGSQYLHSPSTMFTDAEGHEESSMGGTVEGGVVDVPFAIWSRGVPVLHPDSKRYLTWAGLLSLCVLYDLVVVPYRVVFGALPKGLYWYVDSFINLVFMIDVVLCFFTGYVEKNWQLQTDPRKVALHYARTWFLVDLVACLPVDLILRFLASESQESSAQVNSVLRIAKYLRFSRLLRMLRAMKMRTVFHFINKVHEAFDALPVVVMGFLLARLVVVAFMPTHLLACIWWAVSYNSTEFYGSSWAQRQIDQENSIAYTADPGARPGPFQRYVNCLYFSLVTMSTVGYGDVTPRNYDEVLVVGMLLLVAIVAFPSILGMISQVAGELYGEEVRRRTLLVSLSKYLNSREVPRDLANKIRHYMRFRVENSVFDEDYEGDLFSKLTPHLRRELGYHIFGGILRQAPFMLWMPTRCLHDISVLAKVSYAQKGDELFSKGERCSNIYCLCVGVVRILWQNVNDKPWTKPNRRVSLIDSVAAQKWLKKTEVKAQSSMTDPTRLFLPVRRRQGDERGAMVKELQRLERVWTQTEPRQGVSQDFEAQTQLEEGVKYYDHVWKDVTVHEPEDPRPPRVVHAPGFFNESLLWNCRLEDRGAVHAQQMRYCAQVLVNSEFMVLDADSIGEFIGFHPYLIPRLQAFRKEVLQKCAPETGSPTRHETPKFSATSRGSPRLGPPCVPPDSTGDAHSDLSGRDNQVESGSSQAAFGHGRGSGQQAAAASWLGVVGSAAVPCADRQSPPAGSWKYQCSPVVESDGEEQTASFHAGVEDPQSRRDSNRSGQQHMRPENEPRAGNQATDGQLGNQQLAQEQPPVEAQLTDEQPTESPDVVTRIVTDQAQAILEDLRKVGLAPTPVPARLVQAVVTRSRGQVSKLLESAQQGSGAFVLPASAGPGSVPT